MMQEILNNKLNNKKKFMIVKPEDLEGLTMIWLQMLGDHSNKMGLLMDILTPKMLTTSKDKNHLLGQDNS